MKQKFDLQIAVDQSSFSVPSVASELDPLQVPPDTGVHRVSVVLMAAFWKQTQPPAHDTT